MVKVRHKKKVPNFPPIATRLDFPELARQALDVLGSKKNVIKPQNIHSCLMNGVAFVELRTRLFK